MKNLVNYITEKLHISKNIKPTKVVDDPHTKEDYLNLIKNYYREWYEYDWNSDYHTKGKPFNEKVFKDNYDYLIKYADDPYFSVAQASQTVLPIRFIEYMKEKYDCTI